VARTSNSDLLLAKLDLLAKEEAWQPLLVFAETAQLVVLGLDISQAGELWWVGGGGGFGGHHSGPPQLLSSD
jgi:hypothetical protein